MEKMTSLFTLKLEALVMPPLLNNLEYLEECRDRNT